MNKFQSLDAPAQLVQRLDSLNFQTPTPIQAEVIPSALTGNNILGPAQGKTITSGQRSHSSKALQHKHKRYSSRKRNIVS